MAITDNKTAVAAICSTSSVSDRRLRVEISVLREYQEESCVSFQHVNSLGARIGILNDSLCDEYDPTQWVSVSREVILHFLKNRVSTTKCLFSCLQHENIKKHSKDEI